MSTDIEQQGGPQPEPVKRARRKQVKRRVVIRGIRVNSPLATAPTVIGNRAIVRGQARGQG
jgi:hypothetical protein